MLASRTFATRLKFHSSLGVYCAGIIGRGSGRQLTFPANLLLTVINLKGLHVGHPILSNFA